MYTPCHCVTRLMEVFGLMSDIEANNSALTYLPASTGAMLPAIIKD
jgi:hypothetical protein